MKEVYVTKADLAHVGYKAFEKEGNAHFLTVPETAANDRIILRSILKCFGASYEIAAIAEYHGEDEFDGDIEISTNLPWGKYMEIEKANN